MKKITFILLIVCLFTGCNDNDNSEFNVDIDPGSVTFTPVPGGAIMNYELPKNESIYAVRVKYTPENGEEMIMEGTYANTGVAIKGFIDGGENIPAELSYVNFNGQSSKPVTVLFSALPSSAKSLFDNLKVQPYWGGFWIEFEADKEYVDGFINVGYIGIDHNNRETLIYKDTKTIEPGKNQLLYGNLIGLVDDSKVTAIVWTEDFRGNEVYRKEFNVETIEAIQFPQSSITITGDSHEVPEYFIGIQYLNDGDTKGLRRMEYGMGASTYVSPCFLWQTEKLYSEEPSIILDLGKSKNIANIRMYCPYRTSINWNVWYLYYAFQSNLDGPGMQAPNHVKVYTSNDQVEWVESAEFFQSKSDDSSKWWPAPTFESKNVFSTLEGLETVEPCYADIFLSVSSSKYRYIKMEFLSVFNDDQRTSSHRPSLIEIEVYGEVE